MFTLPGISGTLDGCYLIDTNVVDQEQVFWDSGTPHPPYVIIRMRDLIIIRSFLNILIETNPIKQRTTIMMYVRRLNNDISCPNFHVR